MSTLQIPSGSIYIPVSSDKGDCLFCDDGVLVRDTDAEVFFKVDEGYCCDKCHRFFIEGINLIFKFPEYLGIPRRCFVEVKPSNYFHRLEGYNV